MKKYIIPITDLRKTNDILDLSKDQQPIHITKNGYSEMVLLSEELFDKIYQPNIISIDKKNKVQHINKVITSQDHIHGLLNVGAYSLPVKVGNVTENIKYIKESILEAENKNLAILALPELCICGYTSNDLLIQSSMFDLIKKGIREIKEFTLNKNVIVFFGAPIVNNNLLYNCAVCVQNGKILAVIPKRYVPNYKEYYEGRYFTPYNKENSTILIDNEEVPFGNKIIFQNDNYLKEIIGCEICEDAWVSHSPSLDYASSGATIIVNLSASNETLGKDEVRRTLVKEASRKLECVYIYCSSSYEESTTDLLFSGHSLILEGGDIINESELFFPSKLEATIDISRIKNTRRYLTTYSTDQDDNFIVVHYQAKRTLLNTLLNRKMSKYPFIYDDFSLKEVDYDKVLLMQALGVARRLKAINCKNVVLGLSGGLDSTLALLVLNKAYDILNYDKKNITCITLPCFGTSNRTYNNALALEKEFGNTLLEINISKAVEQHLKDIGHENHNYDITYENAQARERTKVLMDYANKVNGIVIGTGDLSEIALGWSTYNGDHMSMYAVNCSIPKTLIRGMFTYFIKEKKYPKITNVLQDVLDTPISPELIPGKNDTIIQETEQIIGPYMLNDFFLYHFITDYYSFSKIYFLAKIVFKDIYSSQEIKKWLKSFIKRFFSSQFKRSCIPDGVKVTNVSLSPRGDFRLPSDVSYQSFIDEIDSLD